MTFNVILANFCDFAVTFVLNFCHFHDFFVIFVPRLVDSRSTLMLKLLQGLVLSVQDWAIVPIYIVKGACKNGP